MQNFFVETLCLYFRYDNGIVDLLVNNVKLELEMGIMKQHICLRETVTWDESMTAKTMGHIFKGRNCIKNR